MRYSAEAVNVAAGGDTVPGRASELQSLSSGLPGTCAAEVIMHAAAAVTLVCMIDGEDHDERVSFDGLDPQQALKALLAVDPDAPPVDDDREPRPEPIKPNQP